ncbi:Uncharacterised protein [Streptococcus suis]|uniref:Uncharacterized protein n=1 Tax=Streptococcus suis TaxID=1307 RepID=A0A0Z8E998_STRSU|nr:Uncharacterised protein [Streptococcus suis]CYX34266.1 Uncharacterised protein [Streptococcus suis]
MMNNQLAKFQFWITIGLFTSLVAHFSLSKTNDYLAYFIVYGFMSLYGFLTIKIFKLREGVVIFLGVILAFILTTISILIF